MAVSHVSYVQVHVNKETLYIHASAFYVCCTYYAYILLEHAAGLSNRVGPVLRTVTPRRGFLYAYHTLHFRRVSTYCSLNSRKYIKIPPRSIFSRL